MKKIMLLWGLFCGICLAAQSVTVSSGKIDVIVPKSSNVTVQLAAQELQKHLQLITQNAVPLVQAPTTGNYHFFVEPPAGKKVKLARENAVVEITSWATYLYGDDFMGRRKWENNLRNLGNRSYRTGTLFAVYNFLEKQFGVKWLEPGDAGIVYPEKKQFSLTIGVDKWQPKFVQRELRCGHPNYKSYHRMFRNINSEFELSESEFEKKLLATRIWLKRQRMGSGYRLSYGHAFTRWWKKYGKTHPEYFAMQSDGVRRPEYAHLPDRCKICVSNPQVHAEIIRLAGNSRFINGCENDSGGFCRCPACLKLDVRRPGEKFDDHLTDRYVWFNNQLQRLAAQKNPEAQVIFYAYSCYVEPPRREKVDPRIIIGFVPSMLDLAKTEKMYRGWQQMGAHQIFLRPNDHHVACGLPMGYEKQLFEAFKLGVKYGIIGTDYDSLHNFWPTGGMADYILARAHIYPDRDFASFEDEYCSSYGAAAPEVKAYYRYWRQNVWEKRLLADRAAIMRVGRFGNFRRGLMWQIKKYYKAQDFVTTAQILQRGAKKSLTPSQRDRLNKLILAQQHARLTFEAMTAAPDQKLKRGKKLLEFRQQHRRELNFDWGRLMDIENQFGDVSGVQLAYQFKNFSSYKNLPLNWYFNPDFDQVGQKEKWEKLSWAEIAGTWSPIRVNKSWENQTIRTMPDELKQALKNFDGIGYYALQIKVPRDWRGRQFYLYFGGVDESALIYLDGQLIGERKFLHADDWRTPFTIRLDDKINWQKTQQTLVVRVKDAAGGGGIWRPVYLVCK